MPHPLPPGAAATTTPLKPPAWQKALAGHPDREFAGYIEQGLEEGFRIGFDYDHHSCRAAASNLASTTENPQVVSAYIENELQEGRIAEISQPAEIAGLQISPFGVIPKREKGKWRLIVDLSSPAEKSVNDGVAKELCSLEYVTVDKIAAVVRQLGPGAMMAKMDIKSAYRNIPVHVEDRPLLGMCWQGRVFLDKTLPFGLRSAPKVFNAVADALEWVARNRGVEFMTHYLDDFTVLGPASSDTCAYGLATLLDACRELGVPVAWEKCEGPATQLTILGIVVDSVAQELRLPQDKLRMLKQEIRRWRGRKRCTLHELQSLLGLLNHACKAVKPGRIFLGRMFRLSAGVKRPSHRLHLNCDFRSDLEWWHKFLERWNGASLSWEFDPKTPGVVVTTDASGSWGCGGFESAQWFMYQWHPQAAQWHIMIKELIPIVMACALWGRKWARCTVLVRSDNMALVEAINRGYSRDQVVMHLLRCVFFF